MRTSHSTAGVASSGSPHPLLTEATHALGSEPLPVVVIASGGSQLALGPLDQSEKRQLQQCEALLDQGLGTFFEVGKALLMIREQRLFRATHQTFEMYCAERWGIGRSYAWRVMGAAERLKLLTADTSLPKPANEFQMRPFLKLEPSAFPKVWKEVTRRAADGYITSHLIQAVVNEFATTRSDAPVLARKHAKRKPLNNVCLGQVLALLHDAKTKVEKGQAEHALEVLQRIESLLFGA